MAAGPATLAVFKRLKSMTAWCDRAVTACAAGRFGQNQWEAIARDERLGLRDKLAAAAAEKTLRKAGKKMNDKDSQLLPRGQATCSASSIASHHCTPTASTHRSTWQCGKVLAAEMRPCCSVIIKHAAARIAPHSSCCCHDVQLCA